MGFRLANCLSNSQGLTECESEKMWVEEQSTPNQWRSGLLGGINRGDWGKMAGWVV